MSKGDPDLPRAWFTDYRWMALPDAAKVVHLFATEYCWQRNRDGHVPFAALRFCNNPKTRTVDRLVHSGLWELNKDGYRLTDYTAHQRTAAERNWHRDRRP